MKNSKIIIGLILLTACFIPIVQDTGFAAQILGPGQGPYEYNIPGSSREHAQHGIVLQEGACNYEEAIAILQEKTGGFHGHCGQTGGPFYFGWDSTVWDCAYHNLRGSPEYEIRSVMFPAAGQPLSYVAGCCQNLEIEAKEACGGVENVASLDFDFCKYTCKENTNNVDLGKPCPAVPVN